MTANGLYLLTVLILHITVLLIGLSRTKHFELIHLLFRIHLPGILLCITTIIISLVAEIITAAAYKISFENLARFMLILTLIMTALTLYKSWSDTYEYFRTISRLRKK